MSLPTSLAASRNALSFLPFRTSYPLAISSSLFCSIYRGEPPASRKKLQQVAGRSGRNFPQGSDMLFDRRGVETETRQLRCFAGFAAAGRIWDQRQSGESFPAGWRTETLYPHGCYLEAGVVIRCCRMASSNYYYDSFHISWYNLASFAASMCFLWRYSYLAIILRGIGLIWRVIVIQHSHPLPPFLYDPNIPAL